MFRSAGLHLMREQSRGICVFVCLCHVIVILIFLSLVYLSIFIYIPAHRVFKSGFDPVPVMCETVYSRVQTAGNWSTCSEWCLTKPAGYCPQINVTVRNNGTELILEGCSNQNTVCMKYDTECDQLPDTALVHEDVSIILSYELEHIYAGKCSRHKMKINDSKSEGSTRELKLLNTTILVASCYTVFKEEENIRGVDCVDGTAVNRTELLYTTLDYTSVQNLTGQKTLIPDRSELTIYNNSRLHINLEACVNTLRNECKHFFEKHSRTTARFPCYYRHGDSSFVLARYDLQKTRRELMIAIALPPLLLLVSIISLFIVYKAVRVDGDGKFRFRWCIERSQDKMVF